MGLLDRLRRRKGEATEASEVTAKARRSEQEPSSAEGERNVADEMEEVAHRRRDERIFQEPRKPPGTA